MFRYNRAPLIWACVLTVIALMTMTMQAMAQTTEAEEGAQIDTAVAMDTFNGTCNPADFPWSVGTETTLNDAISCFNTMNVAGSYTISLTNHISLTASTVTINNDNSTTGAELSIAGDGYTVDGQDLTDVRPFNVATNTIVTMNQLTITGGMVSNSGGGIRNRGFLTIQLSTISNNEAGNNGGGITNIGSGALMVTNSTISNNEAGNDGSGIFNGGSGTLTVTNSTLSNNEAVGDGGGISNNDSGMVIVTNSTLSGNQADFGGGIFNGDSGTLTVTNSTLSGNQALIGGGIDNSSLLSVTNSTISNNEAVHDGGGIFNGGMVTITNSTISGNQAAFEGGGIYHIIGHLTLNNSIVANNLNDDCLLYLGGTVTAVNSLIENTEDAACNISDGVDGNIIGQDPNLGPLQDNGGPTLTHALLVGSPAINAGSDALAVDGAGVALPYDQRGVGFARKISTIDMGAFEFSCDAAFPWSVGTETALNDAISCFNAINVAGSYTISLTNHISLTASTVTINNDNSTTGAELSIAGDGHTIDGQELTDVRPFFVEANTVVTLNQMTITGGKVSGSGGGIRNRGFLTIQLGTISNNEAGIAGGGITNINNGTLTVTNSTLSGNQATYGGGIYVNGTLTVTNSAVSGNQAVGVNGGGGIYNDLNLTLVNSTLSDNEAQLDDGDGIYNNGTLTLNNTIIANSPDDDCLNNSGTVTAVNSFLEDTGTAACNISDGVDGNIVGQDPNVGPLQDNGGPTLTHALLVGSPAIAMGDAGICATAAVGNRDQRGVARPQGVACDIGAYELWGVRITAVTPTAAELSWQAANASCTYDIFESTTPYFTPTEPSTYTTISLMQALAGKLGTVGTNYFYINRATCSDTTIAYSNEVGEFDFALVPGN